MINVLHFRVHDNKMFMQNHFKAQRLIPHPASLARLASGYIYALLSGKRSSSFGWSRQMEGFMPYSKHFFFLLFFCLTKCTSHYFSFSLSRVLPSSNSDSHHWNSVSRRFFSLSLSLFLWDGIFNRKSNPTLPLVLNAWYVCRRGEARGWFPAEADKQQIGGHVNRNSEILCRRAYF